MKAEEALDLFIQKKIGKLPSFGFVAEVIKVNDNNTIDVKIDNDGDELSEVKLSATASADSAFLIIPKVGATVFCVAEDNTDTEAVVVLCDDIDKVILNADLIEFNGGGNGGLVKIKELTDKLNSLVEAVNSFVGTFNSHTHVTTATVLATPAVGVIAPTTTTVQNASSFSKADFENEKILQ